MYNSIIAGHASPRVTPCDIVREKINSITEKVKTKSFKIFSICCVYYPVSKGAVSLARQVGLINPAHTVYERVEPLARGFTEYINRQCGNITAIAQNQEVINLANIISDNCPLQEYLRQVNTYLPLYDQVTLPNIRVVQNPNFKDLVFYYPITEECLYRSFYQRTLFRNIPSIIIKKFFPGKEGIIHTTQAKVLRILISSAIFSHAHSYNNLSATLIQSQMTHTFVLGLFLGSINEMDLGDYSLPLCITLHSFYNLLATQILPYYDECSILYQD